MSQLGSIRIGSPPPIRRGFSIRAKIVALLLAPLLPLVTMSAFAVSIAMAPVRNLSNAYTSLNAAGTKSADLLTLLEFERAASVRYVSTKGHLPSDTEALLAAQRTTDGRIADLKESTSADSFIKAANDRTRTALSKLTDDLAKMPIGRKAVTDGESRAAVMAFYNGLADEALLLYRSLAGLDDHNLSDQAATVVAMAAANEMFSREDALIVGAATAGIMTTRDYTDIVAAMAKQRQMYADVASALSGSDLAGYQRVTSTDAAKRVRAAEDALIASPGIGSRPRVDLAQFQNDFGSVYTGVQAVNGELARGVIDATRSASNSRKAQLIAVIVSITVLLLLLIIFSWLTTRKLLRRIARLRGEALTLAMDRLPSVVERVRAGQSVDVEAEAPPLTVGADELGQLSEAFTRVQRTAIASAVHEATLRQGFNQVFLNIARRSQTLLHRQLALLDAMERRATDPEELEELFRVDHLATRMRRHAEDLVILAGSTPGRGWRTPVPIADVLRAAASEVEEYARINVAVAPKLSLVGRAVNDVVHLLAELLENATMFSPPGSPVTLTAYVVPNGLAVEVEDRGLGMTAEAIEEANARLAVPPDFDPAHSSRLGLFVVAKLANRQNIRVGLRRSAYGGLAAVTLLPNDIVVAPTTRNHPDAIDGVVVGGALDSRPAATSRVMALSGVTPPSVSSAVASERSHEPNAIRNPEAGDVNSTERSAQDGNLTPDGLPKRIRQASVARTLPDHSDDTIDIPLVTAARTPEQMRNMLASFQDGMNQGRAAAAASHEVDGSATGVPQANGLNGNHHHLPARVANSGAHRAVFENGAAPAGGTEDQSTVADDGPPIARGGGDDNH